jgi:hypothetical protein
MGWDVWHIAICEMEEPCLRAQWRDNSAFRVTGTKRRARVCVHHHHLYYCAVPVARTNLQNGSRTGREKRLVFAAFCASWARLVDPLVFSPRIASPRLIRFPSVSFAHICTEGTIRPKDTTGASLAHGART